MGDAPKEGNEEGTAMSEKKEIVLNGDELKHQIYELQEKLKALKLKNDIDFFKKIGYGKASMCKFCISLKKINKKSFVKMLCQKHNFFTKSYNVCNEFELNPKARWTLRKWDVSSNTYKEKGKPRNKKNDPN